MTETPQPADRSPFRRFPYGPALLCAACIAMAAWTWMRYSYAWGATPRQLAELSDEEQLRWYDYLVKVRGVVRQQAEDPGRSTVVDVRDAADDRYRVLVIAPIGAAPPVHESAVFKGRVWFDELLTTLPRARLRLAQGGRSRPSVRTEDACVLFVQGRWHPASIAGIVVGAMGAFVFGLYLRSYLRGRRSDFTTETQSSQRTT
jgi:hypothetical protein